MSAERPKTVAMAFARALAAAGVRRVYGLPGEDHLRLLDALPRADITYVAAREESAAVIMAAAEAQASGRPGVVLVTLAPGITNAINGLAHAWLDHVPLLVVCGQHHPERAPLIVRQSLDTHRLLDGLCKTTFTASTRIHQVLARALDTALAPPAGPVLLELRDDIARAAPLDALEDWPVLQSQQRTSRMRGQLVEGTLDAAIAQRVAASARPAIVVGAGCPTDRATCQAIQRVSCQLRAPVFTTPSALGVVAAESEWLAGTFLNGNLEAELLSRCDLLLTLGLDARDIFNAAWRYTAPVVAINEHPDTQRFLPVCQQLLGDTGGLLQALGCGGSASEWRPRDVAEYRAAVERPFRLEEGAFTIPTALRAARALLPADALLAVDAGFGKPLTSYLWSASRPNTYFTAHGLSTMGYALPAATALQLAYPDRPVVAFMGDGSLLMRASELTVAAEQGIAPIAVAWLDGALAQIETKQLRQRLAPVGARMPPVSCAKIADAFHGHGVDVDSLPDFRAALQAALTSDKPMLIGARVDQSRRAEWYELIRG
jgi:acetolactate synthase-1/2/3 large subunit